MKKKSKKKHKIKVPKAVPRPPRVFNVTKIERVMNVTVPEHMSLEQLANYYRLDGMKMGIETLLHLPTQFRESVIKGEIPQKVETIRFIGMFRRAMKAGFDQVINKIDATKADIERITGFEQKETNPDDLIPDQFVRIIRVPDSEGGGFGAEFDSEIRGIGPTVETALEDLVNVLKALGSEPIIESSDP